MRGTLVQAKIQTRTKAPPYEEDMNANSSVEPRELSRKRV